VKFGGEIGHNAGQGDGVWSAPRGEVWRKYFQIEGRRRVGAGDRLSVHGGQGFLGWKWTKSKCRSMVTHYRIPYTTFKQVEKNPPAAVA